MLRRIKDLIDNYVYDNTILFAFEVSLKPVNNNSLCGATSYGYIYPPKLFKIKQIRKNPKLYDWEDLCLYSKLPERFIEEFQDYVRWEYISLNQALSIEFVRKFSDKIFFDKLLCNDRASQEVKDYCRLFL